MQIRGYEIGKLIGESSLQRIYLAQKDSKTYLFKIATSFENGDTLSDESKCFRRLWTLINQISDFLQRDQDNGKTIANLHYDWLVARLVDSFLEPTQDDRRINVLEPVDASMEDLTPLSKLRAKFEIDARTSVWIFGRLLKLYGLHEILAYDNPVVSYHIFSPDDYLIDPQHHRLIYYNYSGTATNLSAHECVRAIANYMCEWTVADDTAESQQYLSFLQDLSAKGSDKFENVHKTLYNLVDTWWGRKYYPFTYRENGAIIWKTMEG